MRKKLNLKNAHAFLRSQIRWNRNIDDEKVGYALLWTMGIPILIIFAVWLIIGSNIFGRA